MTGITAVFGSAKMNNDTTNVFLNPSLGSGGKEMSQN